MTIHCASEDLELSSSTIGLLPLEGCHTGEYLEKSLDEMIEINGLSKNKIISIASDSAANIKLGIQMSLGAKKHVPCVAHKLSHVVPDTFKQITSPVGTAAIDRIKMIVKVIRRSTLGTDELHRLQKQDGFEDNECLALKQDIEIRWNSTLYMLQRFFEIEDYIYPVMKYMKKQSEKIKKLLFMELKC